MDIKKRKIDIPIKDTMLFISNSILDLKLPSKTSKSKIFSKVTECYLDKKDLRFLIDVLSHDAYKKLKNIYNDFMDGLNVIESFERNKTDELFECLLIILEEVKYSDNSFDVLYTFNQEVFKKLNTLFDEEGQKLAEESYKLERLVKGLLNTYGIIKKEYFLSFINNFLKKNYTYDELIDKLYSKLVLNTFIERFTINWSNLNESDEFVSKIPYSQNLDSVIESQKQLDFDYNIHDLEYYYDKDKLNYLEEFNYDVKRLKTLIPKISDEKINNFFKDVITGIKSPSDILNDLLNDSEAKDIDELIDYLTKLHNDLEAYPLCGHSPNSLKEEKLVN